jgi:hypothetical protein
MSLAACALCLSHRLACFPHLNLAGTSAMRRIHDSQFQPFLQQLPIPMKRSLSPRLSSPKLDCAISRLSTTLEFTHRRVVEVVT